MPNAKRNHLFLKQGKETATRMAPRRARGVGWERLPHLFLPNYGCSASRSYAPSTQNADYGGVEEAARFQPKRSVTYEQAKAYPLKWVENREVPFSWRVEKMKLT